VRDRLVERGSTVFAPCLHAAACPVLAAPTDWCHEDLPVDLPAWVAPLARAAGLRWQGLTFSHLVLRRDARRLLDELDVDGARPRVHLRVISELMRSKGKAEVFACTSNGARVRMRRLDRDSEASGPGAAATTAWARLGRGDVVTIRHSSSPAATAAEGEGEPMPVDERGRVSPTAQIDVWPISH
jgi:hypothetical protein